MKHQYKLELVYLRANTRVELVCLIIYLLQMLAIILMRPFRLMYSWVTVRERGIVPQAQRKGSSVMGVFFLSLSI
jgi:hypothetical protein